KAVGQDTAAAPITHRETAAGAEAAADHQDENRGKRPCGGVIGLQVVENVPGGGGAEHHANQQADVLRERQPESPPVPVGESNDGRDEDEDVYEIDQRALLSNTLAFLNARTSWLGDN